MFYPDPKEVVEYVLKDERSKPEEEQTVFFLRVQTVADHKQIMSGIDQQKLIEGDVQLRTCRTCLSKWENMKSRSGEEIEFSPKKINGLPVTVVEELSEAITKLGELGEDDVKN